ncbi:MAG: hypothetical protein ABIT16_13965 [Croceibacterium sp.]
MNESKTFASLGPTLLARKGGAKPAMRPQSSPVGHIGGAQAAQKITEDLEDLGWNDMGDNDDVADHSAEVLQLTPAPANPEAEAKTDKGSPKPIVRSMHEELAERLSQEDGGDYLVPKARPSVTQVKAPKKPAAATPARLKVADSALRRAAFTLRLDAKRHLKLRLASTVRNRSAQQLVTEALDRFLGDIPEIEALASQVQRD